MSDVQLRELRDTMVDVAVHIARLQKDLDREWEELLAYSEMYSRYLAREAAVEEGVTREAESGRAESYLEQDQRLLDSVRQMHEDTRKRR